MPTVIWIDTDPNICASAYLFRQAGWSVVCFNETADCLNAIKNFGLLSEVNCIITSMMERGGRKERGLMNAFELVIEIKKIWSQKISTGYVPFLGMISLTADIQQCKDFGYDEVVYNDRLLMQKIVIQRLNKNSSDCYKNNWRNLKLLPCEKLSSLAGMVFDYILLNTGLNTGYMDRFANHCFCKNCEPKVLWQRGTPPEIVVLPTGWYRYGIILREEFENHKIDVVNWQDAYHGTKYENIKSIIEEKRILFPGDTLRNGEKIPIAHGQCWSEKINNEPLIYLSPSIKYASHDLYAKPKNINGNTVKFVIQCRVKPGSYKKFPETLGIGKMPFDEHFPNKEIEWVTNQRYAVVPYGLLIGVF